MQIYKVGGAVRDRLLGRPVTAHDWVVVGASAEGLLAADERRVDWLAGVLARARVHEVAEELPARGHLSRQGRRVVGGCRRRCVRQRGCSSCY